MSLLSVLGTIAGVAGAPFTGGASLVPALIGAGADIAGSLINKSGLKNAQAAQTGAINNATNQVIQGQSNAIAENLSARTLVDSRNSPYAYAGLEGLYGLQEMLQGEQPAPFKFDQSKVALDPSFNIIMSEAMKGLSRSAAGSMRLKSGDTYKDLLRYGQDLTAKYYGDAYGREYQSQSDTYRSMIGNQQQRYQNLRDVVGIGQSATNQSNQATLSTAGNISDIYGRTGNNLADLAIQGGNVGAAGSIAGANNLSGLVDRLGQGIGDYLTLRGERRSSAPNQDGGNG